MKYCLRYSNKCKRMLEEADEISIIYNKNDAELPSFLEKHKAQRIILIVNDDSALDSFEIRKLNAIQENFSEQQIAVCLYGLSRFETIAPDVRARMGELKMPWFTGRMATSWEEFAYLLDLGVSDVYISEGFGFELPVIAKLAHKKGVSIRAIPNVAQSRVSTTPAIKRFFIRPEDLSLYEDIIDVVEFWGELRQQDTFFKIYKEKKEWYGNLKEIIFSFDEDLESRCVLPIFGKSRLDCGQRCLKGFHCRICYSIQGISKKLKDNNLIIKTKKDT